MELLLNEMARCEYMADRVPLTLKLILLSISMLLWPHTTKLGTEQAGYIFLAEEQEIGIACANKSPTI